VEKVADKDLPGLLDEVCRRYGLAGHPTSRRLTGGYANDVFRVDHDGGAPVVLHVKHPPSSAASMDWEHRQLLELSADLPEALPPQAALDGSTWFWHDGRPVWLVQWAEGSPAAPGDHRAVAEMLAHLHSWRGPASKRPDHRRLLQLPLPETGEYPAQFDAWLPLIHRERTNLTRLVEWLERDRQPATGLTHNDIFEGNVLVHAGRVSAVLDWEEADLDWLVWDLASALWSFCRCEATAELVPEAMTVFVRTYRAAGGAVQPADDDLLVPLVRARVVLEVLRTPYDRYPQWDEQLVNLGALRALDGSAG
jgi:Ser/Thr protein kinase RdoA (MazF antagonist)